MIVMPGARCLSIFFIIFVIIFAYFGVYFKIFFYAQIRHENCLLEIMPAEFVQAFLKLVFNLVETTSNF